MRWERLSSGEGIKGRNIPSALTDVHLPYFHQLESHLFQSNNYEMTSYHVSFVRAWDDNPFENHPAFLSEIENLSSSLISSPQAEAEAYQLFEKYAFVDDLVGNLSSGHCFGNPHEKMTEYLLRYVDDLNVNEQQPAAIAEKLLADAIRENKLELIQLLSERGTNLHKTHCRERCSDAV